MRLRINHSNINDIKQHFELLPKDYVDNIKSRVDFELWIAKVTTLSDRYEVWEGDILIALVAIYINQGIDKPAYITNVSIIETKQGLGLSKKLLNYLISDLIDKGFKSIKLEVKKTNVIAINLYKSYGFEITEDNSNDSLTNYMILTLDK